MKPHAAVVLVMAFVAVALPNASFSVPIADETSLLTAESTAAVEADDGSQQQGADAQPGANYGSHLMAAEHREAEDDGDDSDLFEGRQFDVQSVINSNLEKQGPAAGHSHHEHAHESANNLFSPATPPRPNGLFGFSFPYANPISILLQPFRFVASSLFGGFRRSAVTTIGMRNVNGELVFSQLFPTFPVMISGRITGLTPGEHAFHIHEFGDLREDCLKAGDHYNPFRSIHAAPSSLRRHVGDLGNIIADNDGVARVSILDHRLTLYGPFSILGRSVVIHSSRDDLGVGGNPSSGLSGNAGDRVACAVIGGGR